MHCLELKNIELRALEPSDIDNLLKWENNPENWIAGIRTSPYSRDSLDRYIKESGNDFWDVNQIRFAITLKSTGLCIGLIDVFNANSLHLRAEVGILIDPSHRGNGFALESLKIIQKWSRDMAMLKSLTVYVFSENTSSHKAFISAGFENMGSLKSWIRTSKGWVDINIFQWLVN
jgi:diamine N-acetyltransferase|tara:strand:+ start:1779 stop:2303 length:525 start_codon:yes stop_codon:yes gene_type:complete